MKLKELGPYMLVTLALTIVSGCSPKSVSRGATQSLGIQSGEIATPGIAVVVSVDFVRFPGSEIRYSETVREVAAEWLLSTGLALSDLLKVTIAAGSGPLAEEIEQFIRDSNCIYVIQPTSLDFLNRVQEDLETRERGAVEIAQDVLTEEEFRRLEDLPFEEYLEELDEIKNTYETQNFPGDDARPRSDGSDLIAVASQCFSKVRIGDTVSVFKFDDLVAISPRTTRHSFAEAQ